MKINNLIGVIVAIICGIGLAFLIGYYMKVSAPFKRMYFSSIESRLLKNVMFSREYFNALTQSQPTAQNSKDAMLNNIAELATFIVPKSVYGKENETKAIELFKAYSNAIADTVKEGIEKKEINIEIMGKDTNHPAIANLVTFLESINPHYQSDKDLKEFLRALAYFLAGQAQYRLSNDWPNELKLIDNSTLVSEIVANKLSEGFINQKAQFIPRDELFALQQAE